MRNRIVRIRVSDAELAALKTLAVARGLSLSDLLRRAAQRIRMPARRFDQADAAILVKTLGELGRIGGNLNQLTRRANAGKLAGHDANLATTLAGIDALRTRVREIIA
ncbi:plasmid mobilization relaxosome protein MobC [Rhizobium ruizarguesonis]